MVRLSFQPQTQFADALVAEYDLTFATDATKLPEFWVEVADPKAATRTPIGYVRFERVMSLHSRAVFVATELRSASGSDQHPEPLLSGASGLRLGGL
jgi:hypothetical protein